MCSEPLKCYPSCQSSVSLSFLYNKQTNKLVAKGNQISISQEKLRKQETSWWGFILQSQSYSQFPHLVSLSSFIYAQHLFGVQLHKFFEKMAVSYSKYSYVKKNCKLQRQWIILPHRKKVQLYLLLLSAGVFSGCSSFPSESKDTNWGF